MQLSRLIQMPGLLFSHTRWAIQDPLAYFQNRHIKRHPEELLGFERMPPMHFAFDESDQQRPSINILVPSLNSSSLTGGTNTALQIAIEVARAGIPVRIIAVDDPLPLNMDKVSQHLQSLAGEGDLPLVKFASSLSIDNPARLGKRDTFLATLWTSAYRIKDLLGRGCAQEFVYLIQDFEPSFYPWSSNYAKAIETYSLPFRALINTQLLADYFVATQTGRFAAPGFIDQCAVFAPAVDRRLFHPTAALTGPRRLLFYARPRQPRNMFGIGLEALRLAVRQPEFAAPGWQFTSIGSTLRPVPLGEGRMLEPAPWMSYEDYACLIRESDILLCPMLSPHPSYPVLEMAASRGLTVTNTFGPKTQARLSALSDGIVAGPPSLEGLCASLLEAVGQLGRDDRRPPTLPTNWIVALKDAVALVKQVYETNARG